MRVTNFLATQLAITDFTSAREQLAAAQRKVTTGHRFETASEDPSAAAGVMQNDAQLRALDQYQRNVSTATRRVTLEETAVDQLSNLLTSAKEIAIGQATATASPTSRQNVLGVVNQLLAQAVQIANSKDGAEYLFGGNTSSTPPFSVDTSGPAYSFAVAAVPPSGARVVEIGANERILTNHDGTQLFGTAAGGPLKALADLAAALQSGAQAAVAGTIDGIDTQLRGVQLLISDAGARADRLQMTSASIKSLSNQLIAMNSDLHDIDLESAFVDLTNRQTAFQAAMAATTRVLGLSIVNYL